MKNIFLYSKYDFPMNLEKVNSCVYYKRQDDTFYKLNVMPPCTVFINDDIQKRQIMNLTKFDPYFLMINILYKQKKVLPSDIPDCLKDKNWILLSTQSNSSYMYDKEKIFDFLQKKVDLIEQYFDDHNPLQRLKLIKLQIKTISSDTIVLLKNELNPQLINQFSKSRYNINQIRKIAPSEEETEALKPKPNKNNKKPVQKVLEQPKNQMTLFSSWKKK